MGKTRPKKRLDFSGVDGEGGDIDGSHEYLLLRAGEHVLETGHPLTAEECLWFLTSIPGGKEYVSYFFDYDVTMMLRRLPEERIMHLLDREKRTPEGRNIPYPVGWGPFEFDYLPKKEFRVRPKGGKWTVISDTGTFFQSAFLKALKRWGVGTEELWEAIGEGKDKRNSFGVMTDETREYNGLEIELLEDLMEGFRRVCEEVGYVPRVWQGPGNIASAMFGVHGISKSEELLDVPHGLWAYSQAAYYGGRFETTAVGDIKGPVYQYDINSAYPYSATFLPCLVHGTWRHTTCPTNKWYVARLSFNHPKGRSLHTFPTRRTDGSIHFPRTGSGWYWSVEIDAAKRAGARVQIHDAWELTVNCDCKPFSFVEEVYKERLRVGKGSKGLALKLALNSIYGKTAQSIGAAPYANPVWAGLFTAITRSMILDAVGTRDDCYMIATDGVFVGAPLDLSTGKALGEWDLVVHEDGMFIIQPGLYFAGTQEPKTRGVPMGKVFERREEFETAWRESEWGKAQRTLHSRGGSGGSGPGYPSVRIPVRNFIGLRLAAARGKLETAGQWVEDEKVISFDWSTKRRPWSVARDTSGNLRTFPYEGPQRTTPYDKMIGGNLQRSEDRLTEADLPEWSEDRLTPMDRQE